MTAAARHPRPLTCRGCRRSLTETGAVFERTERIPIAVAPTLAAYPVPRSAGRPVTTRLSVRCAYCDHVLPGIDLVHVEAMLLPTVRTRESRRRRLEAEGQLTLPEVAPALTVDLTPAVPYCPRCKIRMHPELDIEDMPHGRYYWCGCCESFIVEGVPNIVENMVTRHADWIRRGWKRADDSDTDAAHCDHGRRPGACLT